MKKFISKLICILTIFSMASNAFAGDFFKYNSQRKLILPNPTADFKSLSDDERTRFLDVIDHDDLKQAIGEDLVDTFASDADWYDGILGWRNGYKDDVQNNMKKIIEKIDELQNDPSKSALFHESREDEDFNFYGQMDPPGTPEFCSAYPQITKNNVDAFYEGDDRVENGLAYRGCFGQEQISVPVKELVSDYAKISDFMMKEKENKALDHMLGLVANAMLDKRLLYKGLYENYPDMDRGIKSCLRNKSSKFPSLAKVLNRIEDEENPSEMQTRNPQLLDNYDNFNATLALVAKNHIDKRNTLRQEYDRLSQPIGGGNPCRNKAGAKRTSCIEAQNQRKERRRQRAREAKEELDKQESYLQVLMNESPALFQVENMGGYWAGAEMRIQPTDYLSSFMDVEGADKLASLIDEQVTNVPEGKSYLEVRSAAIEKLSSDNQGLMESFYSKVKDNSAVNQSGNDAVYKQINQLDESLAAVCENDGESLHQYTEMYPGILNTAANSQGSKDKAIEEVKDVQAGLCSMYRKDPPDRNEEPSLAKKVIGYGLIGGGVILGVATFWTGVGTAAGVGIAAAGSAMALGGSTVFGVHAYGNYTDAKVREQNGQAMMSTSWGDVRKLIEAREDRVNARNDVITEAAFAAPDLIGLGLLARSARVANTAAKGGGALAKAGSNLPVAPHGGGALALVDDAGKLADDAADVAGAITKVGPETFGDARFIVNSDGVVADLAESAGRGAGKLSDDGVRALPAPSVADDGVRALPAPSVADDGIKALPAPSVVDDSVKALPAPKDLDLPAVSRDTPRLGKTGDTPRLPKVDELRALPAPSVADEGIKALPAPKVADDGVKGLPAPTRADTPVTTHDLPRIEKPADAPRIPKPPELKALPAPQVADDVKLLPPPTRGADEAVKGLPSGARVADNSALPKDVPRLPAPLAKDSALRLSTEAADDAAKRGGQTIRESATSNRVAGSAAPYDDVVTVKTATAGRSASEVVETIEDSSTLIAKSHPVYKVADLKDFPSNLKGKKISWMGRDGKRRFGIVEKVNKKSIRIEGRKTPLRFENVNGSSISLVKDGRRFSSAADFPDNMMGETISFFSPAGNRVRGIDRGQLIKRNKSSFTVRVANDPLIPIDPSDLSTFRVETIPYSKVHGDSIAHVSYGNANGLRRLAGAEDFTNLTGKRVSFYTPYSQTLYSDVYVVGLNPSKKGIILRRAKPGFKLDLANPASFKEEVFYFSTKRINADSIAVTERIVDEVQPAALAATRTKPVTTGTDLVPYNGGKPPARTTGTDLVPYEGGKPPARTTGTDLVPYEGGKLPARTTGTDVVPMDSTGRAVVPKVYEGEIMPPTRDVVVSSPKPQLEGPIIEGTVIRGELPAPRKALPSPQKALPAPKGDNLPSPVVRSGGLVDEAQDTGRVLEGEIMPPSRDLVVSKPRPQVEGRIIEGTATVVEDSKKFIPRLKDIWSRGREAVRRAISKTREESIWRRLGRSVGLVADDAAQLALDAQSGDRDPAAVAPSEEPVPDDITFEEETEPGTTDPGVVNEPGDDSGDEFSTGDDDEEEDEEEEEVPPAMMPAPRGNPVQPNYIKTIGPTIQVKQGTY